MKREDFMKYGAPYQVPKTNKQSVAAASSNESTMATPTIGRYSWMKEAEKGADTLIVQMAENDPKPASSLPPIPPKGGNYRPPDAWYDNC